VNNQYTSKDIIDIKNEETLGLKNSTWSGK